MPNPREFFEKMVQPSYEAWMAAPLIEWTAKSATSYADIMAERVFKYWENGDPGKIAGATTARQYREHLRHNVCSDFGLVWDIHDGLKHVKLSRRGREVTNATQTEIGQMGYGEGYFGEGLYGEGDQLVITLDNGSKRTLLGAMHNVMTMWRGILADMGL
jgi:hypothetical protein